MKKLAIKLLTFFTFLILLASFVLLKSGSFDAILNSGQERTPLDRVEMATDSFPIEAVDTINFKSKIGSSPVMLPTSKSLILIEQDLKFDDENSDSTKIKK